MDYLRLFRLILRYKWVLLAVVTVATAATWAGARLKGVVYEGTATLVPQQPALQAIGEGSLGLANSLGNQQMAPVNPMEQQIRIQSLVALMTSPRVVGQLITKLGIRATPADLEKMIRVEMVTQEVLRVHATAATPEMAADLANGLASTFVQFYGDLSTNAITESTRLLNEQEKQAGKELEQCKIVVQKYKATHRISSLNDQMAGVLTRLNTVRQAREQAEAQLAAQDAQLVQAQSQLARTPEVVRVVEQTNDSAAVAQLRTEVAQLEKDLALERGIHTEMHPQVRALKAKLASATERLHQVEGRMVAHVRQGANPEYANLSRRVRELRQARDGSAAQVAAYSRGIKPLQQELQSYAGADVQLAGLMQRYNIAEQRWTTVLTRLRQAEANADLIRRSSAIAIVDTAGPQNPPADISQNKAKKLTIAAFCLSLALGVFVLAAWDYLDRRVRTSADAEAMIELPIAGVVPRSLPRPAAAPLSQLPALIPASPETEAYRFLSLHLLLSRSDNPVRVLMTATARPGQGATTMISNLAVTLAQGNCRVILVDADLRRPNLHEIFELPNEVGLTTVLAEGLPVERALQTTLLPNLALLSSGPVVENPWALLRSTAMEGLIRRLRQMADFVLIDTPSAAAFADAFNIAPLVDGVFMVVRSSYQPTGIEVKIKQMFEAAGVSTFGAILNDVPMDAVDSCRHYREHYSTTAKAARRAEAPALPAARR